MLIAIAFLLTILLFLLPFLPGIIELIRKEDAKPLFIPMDYVRNPRYFGKSFKRMLHRATAGYTLTPGIRDVQLSKPEKVEIAHSFNASEKRDVQYMLYVIGNLVSGSNVIFNKEVYATDNIVIGPNNILQALAADVNVTVSEGVQFRRWLDAEGDIDIAANCNLGISASSGGRLYLAGNCNFRRLYAMPILTGHYETAYEHVEANAPSDKLMSSGLSFIRRKDSEISPGTVIDKNVVFPQDVRIGKGSTISGHIKAYGKIVIEADVVITGNILADGDIFVGRNTKIQGHVFSQMSMYISSQSVISQPNKIKSVIGKKSITIEKNVTIYGYVATEGTGRTI